MSEEDNDAAPAAPPIMCARARLTPTTINAADRTVEVVWSTGTRAQNYVPGVGKILEELDMGASAIRMDRLRSGTAPVLDHHRNASSRDTIGRVVTASADGKRGVATLQFSMAADVTPLWERVADGTIRTVSVGYIVHRYQLIEDAKVGTVHRAVDWEPYEISIAPVPVDLGAVVRSDAAASAPAFIAEDPAEDTSTAAPAATMEQTMTDPVTPAAPETVAAPPNIDVAAVRAEAQRMERERIAGVDGVLTAARGLITPETETAIRGQAISGGLTVDAARALAYDAMIAQQRLTTTTPVQTVRMGASGDDPIAIRSAMADAIVKRIKPGFKACERAAEYAGVGLRDMARDLLAARGETNIPRNPVLLAERAFHSSSDFPLLLADSMNKAMLADYELAMPTYRMFMGRRSFNDFKSHKFLRVGDFPALATMAEGGEITVGTISEGRETVTLATYGKGVRVTRQMLVNDDLGAFADFSNMIGRRVLDFENATAFSVLTTASGAGPNLADGSAVFTTGRANRASSAGAIDITTLATGRENIMEKTSPDGLKLNLRPRYLLCGPQYLTIAEQYTSANYVAAAQTNINPFAGRLEPIADANITATNWYLFADPAAAPVYVYGFLNGAEGPQVRTTNPPGTDGAVQIDVWLDFACGPIDFRGGWFNG